jgi:hypothetical protein
MSDLPARTVKKLLVFSLLGFVIFSAMNSVALIMYTNNNADQLEQGLFDACERGNVIRYLLADDNEETIASLKAQIVAESNPQKVRAYQLSLESRERRRQRLQLYPCATLR